MYRVGHGRFLRLSNGADPKVCHVRLDISGVILPDVLCDPPLGHLSADGVILALGVQAAVKYLVVVVLNNFPWNG